MSAALSSYLLMVDRNFPDVAEFLNVRLLFPCSILIITNRDTVRYALAPVDEVADIMVVARVVSESSIKIDDLSTRFQVNHMDLDDHVVKLMTLRGKGERITYPFDNIVQINELFTINPITELVKKWLKLDFLRLFGF